MGFITSNTLLCRASGIVQSGDWSLDFMVAAPQQTAKLTTTPLQGSP